MNARRHRSQGIVLISSLLLLLVLTLLSLSMFRSFGVQEKIAGNLREKHRALQAAESAQQYAEWWLNQGNNVTTLITCSGLMSANANTTAICLNAITATNPNVAKVPWVSATGAPVGVDYTPPGMTVSALPTFANGSASYVAPPRFYISQLGGYAGGSGTVYQVDAVGYGATTDAVAVVESTYLINLGVRDLGS